nr:hypothetical protein [Tanacetum cinerariifolium]
MLNKDNYVPWSSRIIRYARSRPNGKMIVDSIENGPYVRRMIATPREPDLPVLVPESFHEQTDEELTENDIKRMDADDQAIQTILLGLLEDEIWERVRQMMKGSDIGEHEKKAKLFNEWEKFTSTDGESIESYYHRFMQLMNDLKRNKHFPENITANLKTSSNPRNRQIAQPVMNMSQDRQIQNVKGNDGNQLGQYAGQVTQNQHGNQDGLVVVPVIANQGGTGNIVATRAEGDLDEIEEVNANCILMANLQHASTSGTQLDKAPVYDTDGSAEVQLNDNCYDNEIFNMFTQEEQYIDLLEPISEPQLVLQNDNHVTSVAPSMVQSGGTVETSSAPNEETHAHQETVYPKFVRDFKSLAKEVDESLDKQKSLELEIERLLKSSASHDVMSIVQNSFVDVSSDLQTELDRTKEKLELCIMKKEKEYAVLWNNWYTKCEECKYDKISYDKAYNDMQQKVERLQPQLRDLKGKSSDTPSASNTLDPLNQKLESKIAELEFQVVNYERTSVTPHVDKPKLIDVTPHSKKVHASIPSHFVPQPKEFNVVKHSNVIAPGMFKIDRPQTSRVDMVPHKQSSISIRTNSITNFQRHVIFKENMSSDTVNASSTRLVHTGRTRRPQPKGNTRNARVPSASKSSKVKKNVTLKDHRRTLLLSKNQKTMSSKCNNIKLAIWNDKSEIVSGCLNFSMVRRLGLFQAYDWEHQASHNFVWKFLGTVCFGNDHIATILGYGDLKWGNITITSVYFVQGLGHNLFSIYVHLQAPVIIVRTENGTEFQNHALKEYFDSVGITHETSVAKTRQQNEVVERRNRTLVKAARTIKPDISYLHVFGALCYPKNDRDNIGKLGAKGDIGFFIGYSANYVAYRVYNRRIKKIMETMNVAFDELSANGF